MNVLMVFRVAMGISFRPIWYLKNRRKAIFSLLG